MWIMFTRNWCKNNCVFLNFLGSKNEIGWWFYEMNLALCSTSNLQGVGALFDKFHGFFCSKSSACHLASLPSQTKPSGLKPSRAKWNLPINPSHIVASQRKASKPSTAKQTKVRQATKATKPNQSKTSKQTKELKSLASSSQTMASKLNTRNSTKRRRKASFGWVSGVQPREPRKSTNQTKSK